MTYIDRSADARDRAVRRSRTARTALIGTAAAASVGLAGAIGAGVVHGPAAAATGSGAAGASSSGAGTAGSTRSDNGSSGAARLLANLRSLGSGQGLTSGSGGAAHTRTAGS